MQALKADPGSTRAREFSEIENIILTSEGDTVTGSNVGDTIDTAGGNDRVLAGDGNDTVFGQDGNDLLFAENGNDTLFGGTGNDSLFGQNGNDMLFGGIGDDTLDGGPNAGNDTLDGGDGDDIFNLRNSSTTTIDGGEGAETTGDTITTASLAAGVDLDLSAIGVNDNESGVITINGGATNTFENIENIILTDFGDTVTGSDIGDIIRGAAGDDTISGGGGNDNLSGNSGDDMVSGGDGNDQIGGGQGNDTLFGGAGSDIITAGNDQDTIDGGTGNDTIHLGGALTPTTPDGAADVIVFSDGDGDDIISGFEVPTDDGGGIFTGIDTLDVSGLTDDLGDPVTTQDVTVTDVGGNAVLTFPNGESLTLTGVPVTDVSSDAQLAAMGIPLPPTTVVFDMIQLNAGVPANGEELTRKDGDLIEIDEPVTFTQSEAGVIKVDDTAVIDGVTYTVTFAGSGFTDITHKDAGGMDVIVTGVPTRVVTLDDGAGSTLTYLIPSDVAGDIPDIGTMLIVDAFGTADINSDFIDDNDDVTLVCFAGGTEIETADGPVPVEALTVGQMVRTMDHGAQSIRWIGRRNVAAVGKHAPIVFEEDAIGNKRELTVSPQHRMLVSDWKVELLFAEDQVLVAAKHMVNGTSIKQVEGGEVEYFHILFDRHEIIFADGCAAESFYLGDESLKALGEITRQQFYKEFPALIDEAKSNKARTARHCLKGFEAALLFDNISSLSCRNPGMITEIRNVKLA